MPCYFGIDNVFEKPGTITVTNEADGYPKENGFDWLLFDFWRPGVTGDQSITIELNNAQVCKLSGYCWAQPWRHRNRWRESILFKRWHWLDRSYNWRDHSIRQPDRYAGGCGFAHRLSGGELR